MKRVICANANETSMPAAMQDDLINYIAGGYGSPTEAMSADTIQFIKQNMSKYTRNLYRLEEYEYTAERLSEGDVFSFQGDIRSFSQKESYMYDAIDEVGFDSPVVFRTVGITSQFDVNQYVNNQYFDYQEESLVGGTFRVERIYDQDGLMYYDIKQLSP